MASIARIAAQAAICLTFVYGVNTQSCITFGVDFQDGGSYFQNSQSPANFTFVSEYRGCNTDVANNILVDSSGDEWQCSNTNLTPPDTPALSTCPIEKMNLTTGSWSILILSNNGNGDPIAYERDFYLTVGPQQTSTVTPTVTLSATSTPIINTTSISTFTSTSVLTPGTVTSPATILHPSTTVTPKTSTTTSTKFLATITLVDFTLSVSNVYRTAIAKCTPPPSQRKQDIWATITPTLVNAAALETILALIPRRNLDRRVPNNKMQRIQERKARFMSNEKRAPDLPTVTVTDTNTADYVTTTVTSTAPASTVTVVSITTSVVTSTPPPVTVLVGTSTAPVVTVTAPTPVKTKTAYGIATTHQTVTLTEVVIVTTTVTPASAAAACTSEGGTI